MAPSIQFENVTKRYRIGQWLPSIREALSNNGKTANQYHLAVNDVSFALEPGEALGVIGPNGAGKTTILKLLSGVTHPTSGQIAINGRFSALIELGAGFHPDLSGRENIFLNGTILGMPRAEIQRRFDQIVDFASIGPFLDTPVKRYSSGMYARLGFSIAAHVDPDVLLVDEVLAVGDYAFQQKCYAHMEMLRRQGTSLIFVSHNMEAVRRVCDRGLVMYRGNNIFQGSAAAAVIAYSDAVREAARATQHEIPTEDGLAERVMTFDAEITRVTLMNEDGQPITVVSSGDTVCVAVDVRFNKAVDHPIFSFTVRTVDGRIIYDTTTRWRNMETPCFTAGEACRIEYDLQLPLLDGEFELGVDVAAADFSHYYDRLERAHSFWVQGGEGAQGLIDLGAMIAIQRLSEPIS
ncbi:MAG TPA: ABC transporter ATP-binding protein [Caldilineaceae bacterium]|nr:ABC transporter ATP-binding protein [Caldilineaceae bacterium]